MSEHATDAHIAIDRAAFKALIAVAGRAPSVHNTQPWRFRLVDPQTIEVELIADRVLPHVDRHGREAVISCGAALHNLVLAMAARGLRGRVTLVPDSDRPLVLASVVAETTAPPTAFERRAFAVIPRRHTHRSGFEEPVTDLGLRLALTECASTEGCELIWVAHASTRARLLGVARAAADHEHRSSIFARDTERWVNGAPDRRDGISRAALAPRRAIELRDDRLPDRFLSEYTLVNGPASPGTLAVLVAPGDGVADWLAAGQALQRLLLRAAQDWAFAAVATPALEIDRYREAVRRILHTAEYPQMLLEFGYSRSTIPSARRDVECLITVGSR